MTTLIRNLWQDEAGLILSAELVIILTVAVLGMIVGLVSVQNALLNEFADIGLAFQHLNQSYSTPSYNGCWKYWGRTSWTAGSYFIDTFEGCTGSYGNANGCEIASGGNCPTGCSTAVDSVVPPAPVATPGFSAPATTNVPTTTP